MRLRQCGYARAAEVRQWRSRWLSLTLFVEPGVAREDPSSVVWIRMRKPEHVVGLRVEAPGHSLCSRVRGGGGQGDLGAARRFRTQAESCHPCECWLVGMMEVRMLGVVMGKLSWRRLSKVLNSWLAGRASLAACAIAWALLCNFFFILFPWAGHGPASPSIHGLLRASTCTRACVQVATQVEPPVVSPLWPSFRLFPVPVVSSAVKSRTTARAKASWLQANAEGNQAGGGAWRGHLECLQAVLVLW